MPYLNLFRAGSLPSFSRLPITPGPPAAGQYWRLKWEAADQALVLPGERLCAFSAETGTDTLTAVAPVPGRLEITVPAGRFLAAETTVGELHYGTALEAEFRREAAFAAQSAAGPDTAALAAEQAQLAADTAALERELQALRERRTALAGNGGSPAAPPDTAALATRLPRLLQAIMLRSRGSGTIDSRTRLRLLELLAPLRQALVATGKRRAVRPPAADAELHRAIAALDHLYSDRMAWAAADPPDLPDTLFPKKLAIWKDLRDQHIARLWEEGLPSAGGEGAAARGGTPSGPEKGKR